jgi:nucleotide-binding universal stress UspA family protein
MYLNILVAVDGSESSQQALDHAARLAAAANALLTLVTVAPPVPKLVALAGASPETLQDDVDGWAERILAEAARTVPADVIVHRVQRSGQPGPEIVKELGCGSYDLVVLGTRGRRRAQEGLLGSVNGYVHFHSSVPLLSVPEQPAVVAAAPRA